LGTTLDGDLSGTSMPKAAFMKASKGLRFLYCHKLVLGVRERKLLANALLQPRVDYGCNLW